MSTPFRRDDAPVTRHHAAAIWIGTAFVVAVAFAMRLWFQRGGLVANPMIGDAIQYCDYAWNLAHYHVFSMAAPGSDSVPPDAFRDPGYPLFLASLLLVWGSGDPWYHTVLLVQALIGALTAGLTVALALRWLRPRWALGAGLAVALWPHNVAIAGYLLSETLFGFMALLALWLYAWAAGSRSVPRWIGAGVGFGAAAMVNATLVLLGPLLALSLLVRGAAPRRLALALLLGSLLLPGAWAVRGASLPAGGSNRAIVNLVQGSWPAYHSSYIKSFFGDAKAQQVQSDVAKDVELAGTSPRRWLAATARRFAAEPMRYLGWYAWKPALMWAWSIRIGVGDVYPYPTEHPIYNSVPALRLFESLCVGVNPLLFALMGGMALLVLARPARLAAAPALYAAALLVVYETLIYTVLQSEPRYSIPFRPLEIILVATALAGVSTYWQRRA
ncbi:MAG: hypothetical protein P4L83_10845 [Nevskia sp.]|nr:hypothetical protein [Nevskia sp.]